MKFKLKHKSLALLLAVTIMLGVCLPMLASATDDTSGGFDIGMYWNMTDTNTSADQLSYNYASNQDETKALRLAVRYQNKNMGERVYAPGEVVLTVKGIGGAFRSGVKVADSVAADKASDISKSYAWSYTYTAATDTYTFTNNNTLSSLENFAGSFEILWLVSSRTSIASYSATLQAELIAAGGVSVKSNTVTYSQSRVKDDFTLQQEANRIYTAEGYANGINADDYWWVNFTARSQHIERSLGLSSTYIEILLPVGATLVHVAGGYTFGQSGTEVVGGVTYNIWRVSRTVHTQSNGTAVLDYIVRYDKATFPAESEMHGSIRTMGIYHESNTAEVLATDTLRDLYFGEFEFLENVPGNIYSGEKIPSGTGRRTTFAREHCIDCYEYGYVDSRHFVNGGGTYSFTLRHKLNYPNMHHEFYDWMITDDAVQAETLTGEYRKLKETEFQYKTLTIPAISEILNFNDMPIQSGVYPYTVFVKTSAGGAYTQLTSGVLGDRNEIILPANTCGFQIKFENLTESMKLDIPVTIDFHIGEGSDLKPKDNIVYNTMVIDLYLYDSDESGGEYTKANPLANPNGGVPGDSLYFYADLHVLEVPNFYHAVTSLSAFGDVQDGARPSTVTVGTAFDYNEGETLREFAIYTILPKGLHLPSSVVDAEALYDLLKISGFSDLTTTELMRALTIKLQTDYQGSGRTYIEFYFSLPRDYDPGSQTLRIEFPVQLPLEDFFSYGPSFQARSVSKVYDTGLKIDPSAGIAEDDGFYANIDERSLWRDINHNGDTEEAISYANSIVREVVQAAAMEAGISKLVATESTGNRFVQPVAKDGVYEDDEIPMVSTDGTYTYRLRMAPNSQEKDTLATDIVLFDVLETGPNARWKGEIVSIDTSAAEALLTKVNGKTVKAKVYYSNVDYNSAIAAAGNGIYKPDLSTADWSETFSPTAKTIAVSFGDAELTGSEYLTVDITMLAPDVPEDDPIIGTITENVGGVYYREVNNLAGSDEEIWLPSNAVPVKLKPFMATVTIIKTDKTDGSLITGAVFDLYKQLGASPVPETDEKLYEDLTTNIRGRIVLRNLEAGTYYLMETSPPSGYIQITTPIVFKVESEAEFTVTVENTRKDGTVTLYKRSDRKDAALAGAVFQLYLSDGTLYRDNLVVPASGRLVLTDLPWGSYYFVEKTPPDGFELPENNKFPFEISAENDAGELLDLVTVINKQLPASVIMTKLEKLEDGTETTNPLRGATYRLYDENDTDLGAYVTDADGKIYLDDMAFGKYYFKETMPATGYELYTEKIEFEVTAEHTRAVLQITTYDQRHKGSVWLQKLDDVKAYVPGAVYGLYKAGETTPIQTETTNSEGILEFKDLFWGSYYVKELSSPSGYVLDETEYPVEINAQTASVTIALNVVDNRLQGKARLVKTDETGTVLLNGAKFNLYHADGTLAAGPLTTGAGGENGVIEVDGLDWGSYYFQEIEAPAGYGLSDEKIRFSINAANASTTVEVDAVNVLQGRELTIIKEIEYADLVFAHGNPTFTYKISGKDVNGTDRVWYQAITFSKAYADANVNAGKVRGSFTLTVPAGTYTATEIEVIRYELGGVKELTNPNVTTPDGASVVFDMTGSYEFGSATFYNNKVKQSGTSDAQQITNIVKMSRKLVSIAADYRGTEAVDESGIDRNDLTVTAYYDDGSERVLGNSEYTLEHDPFDGTRNGRYTITVVYTENGVTRKAYFEVEVFVTPPFIWEEIEGVLTIVAYTGSSAIVNFPSEVTGRWTINKDTSVQGPARYAGSVYIKDGITRTVKAVGDDATSPVNNGVTQMIFADGIETINSFVGRDVATLQSLTFSQTLKTIGSFAFSTNPALTGDLILPDSLETIGQFAFGSAGYTGQLKMGAGLKTIGRYAFRYVDFSGKLEFPDSLRTIDQGAFDAESTAQPLEVDFGNGVEYIGYSIFGDRTITNTHLKLPDSVRTIEENAFHKVNFVNGPTLYLGNQIQTIGDRAFQGRNITGDLIFPDTVTHIGDYAFSEVKSSGVFHLSQGLQTIGKYAFYWTGLFTTDIEVPGSLEIVSEGAFYIVNSTAGLILHEGIKQFDDYCFASWSRDTAGGNSFQGSLILPSTTTQIGKYAFYYNDALTAHDFVIPPNVQRIEDSAFEEARSFTGTLLIPGHVTFIGKNAFSYLTAVDKIILSEGIETIENSAFSYASKNVGPVEIPSTVHTLGTSAFAYNSLVEEVVVKTSLITKIPNNCFTNNYALKKLTLPSSITEIGSSAFYNHGIETITIPSSVITINSSAFYGGDQLSPTKRIIFEGGVNGNVKTIGSTAFGGLVSVEEPIYLPKTLTDCSSMAFNYVGNNSTIPIVLYIPDNGYLSGSLGIQGGRYSYYTV